MNKPDFPLTLDNTILSTFRTCERLGYLQYLNHWKSKNESVHLLAGGAFAAGLEEMRKSFFMECESPERALQRGFLALTKHYGFADHSHTKKSWEACVQALVYYSEKFKLTEEKYVPYFHHGQSTVEYSFAFPLPVNHPQTNEPLIYVGRADQLVKDRNGIIYLEDDKTTSQLGATFADKWDMRSQFTGYMYAAQEYGQIPVRGILIRGICFYAGGRIDSQEVFTYRSRDEIEQWYETTVETAERLVRSWENEKSLMNLGDACEAYGGCQFKHVCKSKSPESWLRADFQQKIWDPVNRQEIIFNSES